MWGRAGAGETTCEPVCERAAVVLRVVRPLLLDGAGDVSREGAGDEAEARETGVLLGCLCTALAPVAAAARALACRLASP